MKSLRNILPVLCLVNLLLFMMLAQHWWLGALVGLLIGAAFYLTCLPQPLPATAPAAAELPPAVASDAPLAALLREVLPVWRGNVQLARAQTQSAIDSLSARFVGIHERLVSALDPVRQGSSSEIQQTIQHAAEQLGTVATALESMLAQRQALASKFDTVVAANDEIRRLAQQNEQLAGQTGVTDLLSDEQSWQELAERSAENSRQIAARAKTARQQILAAIGAGGGDAGQTEVVEHTRAVIDGVIADFRHSAMKLSNAVEQLQDEGREVDREVSDILVQLQFQDRISQILDHVQLDIVRLRAAAEAGPGAALPSPQQWLADLEKTYTTQEQRQVHAGQQGSHAPSSQVDFF